MHVFSHVLRFGDRYHGSLAQKRQFNASFQEFSLIINSSKTKICFEVVKYFSCEMIKIIKQDYTHFPLL